MVNGVSDDFWATLVDPDPTRPKKRTLTVWGTGAVNVNTANAATLLGVVCAGAPLAEVCVDPVQTASFVTGVTMAQGMSMGAPLFGSASDFIATLKGQGVLGPLLTGMGVKPVKFQSDSEFSKSITTESKMFSIYAVGVVKGYKRETRLSIHTVVDFRAAPVVDSTGSLATASGTAGQNTPASASSAANGAAQGGAGTNPLAASLQPSTGGQVVYYHVE